MMKPPFLRTPYNYDRDVVSDESGLACADPSLAQQQTSQALFLWIQEGQPS
jgi:hypothetical protein